MLKLSRDTRLFYIGLWNFADDNGVLEHDPLSLKARIFPCDDVDVSKCIKELHSVQKVMTYKNGNEREWLMIVSFSKHQNPDRPRKSNLPLPTDEQVKSAGITCIQLKSPEISSGEDRIGEDSIGGDVSAVIRLFNQICGTRYEPTNKEHQKLISARFSEGATMEDFEIIIRHKHMQWSQDQKMKEYLRPSTLFIKSHWEDYLNAARKHKPRPNRSDV
jgi:uncharacterized phage protein (TIGR02220 family)